MRTHRMPLFYALADPHDEDGAVVGGSPLPAERGYDPPPVQGELVSVPVVRVVGHLEGRISPVSDDRGRPVWAHQNLPPVVGRPLPWVDTGGRRHAHLNRQHQAQQRWRYVTVEQLEQYLARPRALRVPTPTLPAQCLVKLRGAGDRAQVECVERLRHRYVRVTLGRPGEHATATATATATAVEPMRLPRPLLGRSSVARNRSYPDVAAEGVEASDSLLRRTIAAPWVRLQRVVHAHMRMTATLAERSASEAMVQAARDDLARAEAAIARAMANEGVFDANDVDNVDNVDDADLDDYGYPRPRPFVPGLAV